LLAVNAQAGSCKSVGHFDFRRSDRILVPSRNLPGATYIAEVLSSRDGLVRFKGPDGMIGYASTKKISKSADSFRGFEKNQIIFMHSPESRVSGTILEIFENGVAFLDTNYGVIQVDLRWAKSER
jgi:hypothetical protein